MIKCEFRAEAKLEGNTLTGYAHVFGQRAFMGSHYEEFRAGAFDEALKKSDPRATIQHDLTRLLGRQSAGTLKVSADDVGLRYKIDLPNTSYAQDLKELINRGDVTEMSFGFIPDKAEWSKGNGGEKVRTHLSVRELVDVSPVAIPAFSGTSIEMRSQTGIEETVRSQIIKIRGRVMFGKSKPRGTT